MTLRKPVVEYHLRGYLKAMLWFIAIYMGIYLLAIGSLGVVSFGSTGNDAGGFSTSGIEFAFGLFFLVACMASYKEENDFLLQHGVSRKAAFIGFVVSTVIGISIGALLVVISDAVFRGIISVSGVDLGIIGVFSQFFAPWSESVGRIPAFFVTFLWMWTYFFAAGSLGYSVASIFHRLSKMGKILICAGAGVTVIIILPFINTLTGGRLGATMLSWLTWMLLGGGDMATPIPSMTVFFFFTLVSLAICWLFMRRFQVQK